MANYFFLTNWRFDASIEQVWAAVYHSENWPQWWSSVQRVVELEKGDAKGVGSVKRYEWRGRLPYTLAFNMRTTLVKAPHALEGEARGDLEGTGRWELSHVDGATKVRYTWSVRTTQLWMNLLAPVAAPFFRWNHDFVMKQGEQGLARLLNAGPDN